MLLKKEAQYFLHRLAKRVVRICGIFYTRFNRLNYGGGQNEPR